MTPDHHWVSRNGCGRLPGEPRGFVEWLRWAEEKAKTHLQWQCRRCRKWHVWVDREWATNRRSAR